MYRSSLYKCVSMCSKKRNGSGWVLGFVFLSVVFGVFVLSREPVWISSRQLPWKQKMIAAFSQIHVFLPAKTKKSCRHMHFWKVHGFLSNIHHYLKSKKLFLEHNLIFKSPAFGHAYRLFFQRLRVLCKNILPGTFKHKKYSFPPLNKYNFSGHMSSWQRNTFYAKYVILLQKS